MLTLSPPSPTEWANVRTMYAAYLSELGRYGKRDPNRFDAYRQKPDHNIITLRWENTIVGFAFLRWDDVEGTALDEYYVDPAFRGLDIAFLGFKLLSETWPGRWEGLARAEGNISAFWRWSIRRLKGTMERNTQHGDQFIFSFYTQGTAP